jgi:hypothetical protein
VGGMHVQKLKIHYNCVGSIEVAVAEAGYAYTKRKGVAVYSSPKAV